MSLILEMKEQLQLQETVESDHQVYEGNEYLLVCLLAGELRRFEPKVFQQFIKNANDILLIEGQSRSIP